MSEPSLALQGAAVAALKANAAVAALIGAKVYDRVPEQLQAPYANVADFQTIQDDAACIDGTEIYFSVHCWSTAVGRVEAAKIAGAVQRCLHGAEPELADGYALVLLEHRDTRYLDDPDGLTTHAVVTFRALVDTQ
jgi:hypothetical protein